MYEDEDHECPECGAKWPSESAARYCGREDVRADKRRDW